MRYGLLGRNLSHSFSKYIHSQLGNYSYDFFEREPNEIEDLIKRRDIGGLNITIPYKERIMEYCHELTDRAQSIGCINTIVYDENRRIKGDNTDYFGFSYIVNILDIELENKLALILGNGATSKTVAAVLKDKGANYVKISRSEYPYFSDIEKYKDAKILINTSPVGMYPNNGRSLVNLEIFNSLEAVVDVIYNPLSSKLLLDARRLGLRYSDGLPMLVAQAAKASEIFMEKKLSKRRIKDTIDKLRYEFGNIILVGMPGSGKTTVGREIAAISGKAFIDLDEEIEKKSNMKVAKIFEKYGENYFRDLESQVVEEFGKESGLIIASGGGVVTRRANYDHLAQNGRIYLIKRELDQLAFEARPLSKDIKTVRELWEKRKDLYEDYADKSVENINVEKTAREILEEYNENIANQWT